MIILFVLVMVFIYSYGIIELICFFFFSSRRRHTRSLCDWSSDVCSSDLVLIAEVHDNYAAALGGVAGHAGLFSTAPALGAFARTILRAALGDSSVPAPFTPALVARATRK